MPQNGLRNSFSSSGLKWKVERRDKGLVVRCEATAVAEKEVPETSGERHEYQAEVGFSQLLLVCMLLWFWVIWVVVCMSDC